MTPDNKKRAKRVHPATEARMRDERKKHEHPAKETSDSIREWLGFDEYYDEGDESIYYNRDYDRNYMFRITDMWSAAGEKSGLKYSADLVEMDDSQLDDVDEMQLVIEQDDKTPAKWKKLPRDQQMHAVLLEGQAIDFLGDFKSKLAAWKELRQKLHPHMIFERVKSEAGKKAVPKRKPATSKSKPASGWVTRRVRGFTYHVKEYTGGFVVGKISKGLTDIYLDISEIPKSYMDLSKVRMHNIYVAGKSAAEWNALSMVDRAVLLGSLNSAYFAPRGVAPMFTTSKEAIAYLHNREPRNLR